MLNYDKIVIGAGLYGLYGALKSAIQDERVLVFECDCQAFQRATFANQARIHMGYHYPRSFSTAIKSAGYFDRFCKDYTFAIYSSFDSIYATSSRFSWTNASEFRLFCKRAGIRCEDVSPSKFFNNSLCDGAFLTTEYTYDAQILKDYFVSELAKYDNVKILYNCRVADIEEKNNLWQVTGINNLTDERYKAQTPFILNATYASVNEIHKLLGIEPFKIKYELCEVILCKADDNLRNVGITVMDGPFFSIMPFGKTGLHSLTGVTFTPHESCYDEVASFPCMNESNGFCGKGCLNNCNNCSAVPESAWPYMSQMVKKYLKKEYGIEYIKSLFSVKPVLKASEIDDSRPTVIKEFYSQPKFVSVLSGKINTVYDLDEVLSL
ncbi:MAG: FAD-dependent oxidoreductase [Deferribacterales bacterium]|nr:FAD-dependent oxidoreductase [Deferribacterales bacterium]